MNALDSLLNFIVKQAEEDPEVSQTGKTGKKGGKDSLTDKHKYHKDAYQKFLSVQESLDKLVRTKEKKDPAYDKYADPVYADKAKEISSGLALIETEAKKIGTILPSQ